MAITTSMATSYKQELMEAEHDHAVAGHSFKMALYDSTAAHTAATAVYTATNEISGTGYTATGKALTNIAPTSSGTTAYTDYADISWTSASFTANGCMIYNDTHASDAAVSHHYFGSDKTVSSGTFTVQFPTADASNAIIRIA